MLNDTLHKEEKESLTANLELENKLEQTRTEYEKKLNNLKKELNEMRLMNFVITIQTYELGLSFKFFGYLGFGLGSY